MSRQANDQEKPDGRDRKPKPHEMGMQVPHCVHTERSKKGLVRPVEEGTASGVSRIGTTQGMRDRGRAHDGGPVSYTHLRAHETDSYLVHLDSPDRLLGGSRLRVSMMDTHTPENVKPLSPRQSRGITCFI